MKSFWKFWKFFTEWPVYLISPHLPLSPIPTSHCVDLWAYCTKISWKRYQDLNQKQVEVVSMQKLEIICKMNVHDKRYYLIRNWFGWRKLFQLFNSWIVSYFETYLTFNSSEVVVLVQRKRVSLNTKMA